MGNYKTLTLNQDGDVLVVTLDRDSKRNAVNEAMTRELINLTEFLADNEDIAYVVFTHAGSVFSAGADGKEMMAVLAQDIESASRQLRTLQRLGQDLMARLEGIEQITIAALEGKSYGAGFALALAADLRIMSTTAGFALPETAAGTFLAWACTPRLVGLVGPAVAKEMILLGDLYDALECKSLGLTSRVVEPGQAYVGAMNLVTQLRDKGSSAKRLSKKMVNLSAEGNNASLIEPELVGFLAASGELSSGFSKVGA